MDKHIADIFGYIVWSILLVFMVGIGLVMFRVNQIPNFQETTERTIAVEGGLNDGVIDKLNEQFNGKAKVYRAVDITELNDKNSKDKSDWVGVVNDGNDTEPRKDGKLHNKTEYGKHNQVIEVIKEKGKPDTYKYKHEAYGTRVDYVLDVSPINVGKFHIGTIPNVHSYGLTLVR